MISHTTVACKAGSEPPGLESTPHHSSHHIGSPEIFFVKDIDASRRVTRPPLADVTNLAIALQ